MTSNHMSSISGYSGILAVLTSIQLTEALQIISLTLGIIFLILGCTLRIMELKDRRKPK